MVSMFAAAVRDRNTLMHCEYAVLLHCGQVSVVFVALAESPTATAGVSRERFPSTQPRT